MKKTRLKWTGNQQAQREADRAFKKLKPKKGKKAMGAKQRRAKALRRDQGYAS